MPLLTCEMHFKLPFIELIIFLTKLNPRPIPLEFTPWLKLRFENIEKSLSIFSSDIPQPVSTISNYKLGTLLNLVPINLMRIDPFIVYFMALKIKKYNTY